MGRGTREKIDNPGSGHLLLSCHFPDTGLRTRDRVFWSSGCFTWRDGALTRGVVREGVQKCEALVDQTSCKGVSLGQGVRAAGG